VRLPVALSKRNRNGDKRKDPTKKKPADCPAYRVVSSITVIRTRNSPSCRQRRIRDIIRTLSVNQFDLALRSVRCISAIYHSVASQIGSHTRRIHKSAEKTNFQTLCESNYLELLAELRNLVPKALYVFSAFSCDDRSFRSSRICCDPVNKHVWAQS
jgi:hypothetical protein